MFAQALPSQSEIANLTVSEKMMLYEKMKQSTLTNIFNRDIGYFSKRGKKIRRTGYTVSILPFVAGLIFNQSNQAQVYFVYFGIITTYIWLYKDIENQIDIYNDKLYKEIILID